MTTPEQPELNQLFAQFLQRRAAQPFTATVDEAGEVLPFQAAMLHVVEPSLAFREAMEAAGSFLGEKEAGGFDSMKAPSDWPSLVRSQESYLAIPFCLGNFPQLMQDVSPLLQGTAVSELQPSGIREGNPTGLLDWGKNRLGKKKFAEALFAAGALRLAGTYDAAKELLDELATVVPATWSGLLANEQAALAWQQGERDAAQLLWEHHLNQDCPAVLFNRGLALLFSDRAAEAATFFTRAAEAIPETSGWNDLARLYLTLAESA